MFRTLLFLTVFATVTAGAPTVVPAKAITHPAWLNDHSDITVGAADLVEIKGGKPAGLRPKFNNAARQKMAAPRTKPPVASRQAVKARSATGRALPSRVQGVKLPAQTRGIIKKPTVSAAAKKLNSSTKPWTKMGARAPSIKQTPSASTKLKLRTSAQSLKANFSGAQLKNASLRAGIGYKDGTKNAVQHSLRVHGHGNATKNKSEFSKSISASKLGVMTRIALKKGNINYRNDGSAVITHRFSKPVGKNQKGKAVSSLRVILRDNKVQSIHPGNS